jgi:hypothetical protein
LRGCVVLQHPLLGPVGECSAVISARPTCEPVGSQLANSLVPCEMLCVYVCMCVYVCRLCVASLSGAWFMCCLSELGMFMDDVVARVRRDSRRPGDTR